MWKLSKNAKGDTLVEVLICIAVIAQIFVVSFAAASHALDESIIGSEHTQALKLAQSQVEALRFRHNRSSVSYWTTNFTGAALNFCLNTSVTEPGPNWDPIAQTPTQLQAGGGFYDVNCASPSDPATAKYFINISTPPAPPSGSSNPDPTYLVTVKWNQIASSNQDVTQIYYRLPTATVGSPSGGGGSTGGSSYTPCQDPTGTCTPVPGYYTDPQNYLNLTNNTDLSTLPVGVTILSCDWDWGDGVMTHTACQPGQNVVHNFPPSPPAPNPTFYWVSLTLHLSDGSTLTPYKAQWQILTPYYVCDVGYTSGCSEFSTNPPPGTFKACDPNPLRDPACLEYPPGTVFGP